MESVLSEDARQNGASQHPNLPGEMCLFYIFLHLVYWYWFLCRGVPLLIWVILCVAVANGSLSVSSTSGSPSRRESVGTIPKCDNVKKCPDKKQIEEKLNQIRAYLQVTTSLMSSIKNTDDQVINYILGCY